MCFCIRMQPALQRGGVAGLEASIEATAARSPGSAQLACSRIIRAASIMSWAWRSPRSTMVIPARQLGHPGPQEVAGSRPWSH